MQKELLYCFRTQPRSFRQIISASHTANNVSAILIPDGETRYRCGRVRYRYGRNWMTSTLDTDTLVFRMEFRKVKNFPFYFYQSYCSMIYNKSMKHSTFTRK